MIIQDYRVMLLRNINRIWST